MTARVPWNAADYHSLARRACFICELLAGNPDYPHHIAYRDDVAVVFASRFPSVTGHFLVAPVERLYVLSLGSQQGNRHVHRHLAPLPPGVPYEDQQFAVFEASRGYLDLPDEEVADLARRLGDRLSD